MSDTRNYLEEARAILAGTTLLPPTVAHLRAMLEWHDVTLIRIANDIEALKHRVLNRE